MLLHVFVGDGQLVKPPDDLLSINLVICTAGGYGKGGKEFECGSNWTSGTFLRFHHTLVAGYIDDPKLKTISFELKGCYKDAPAKEVSLGIAAIETNPKQKARTISIELTNLRKEAGGAKTAATVCKLAITLFHNRFAIDLSPDEVALQHKRELLEIKEKKTSAGQGPPPQEYSFLLTRKINWDTKRKASFSKDTEHLLDEDVYKNLKDFQVNKKKTKEYKRRHRLMKNKFAQNQPPLAYFARKGARRRPGIGETPYRITILGVGYVGERINPVAAQAKERVRRMAQTRKINIPFSKQALSSSRQRRRSAGDDPLDELYNKILSAEKRRVKALRKTKSKAKEQVELDRVRAQIISEKKAAQNEEDEQRRAMVQRSDSQMKELRTEINRRQRKLAFLGLQKHLSEADQRKKEAEEKMLKDKLVARISLEKEAAQVMTAAHRVPSPQRNSRPSDKAGSCMSTAGPLNAFPLRKAPSAKMIAQRKAEQDKAIKTAERLKQEKEARESKVRMLEGLAGAHIPKVPFTKPMPVEKNRVPLRSVDLARLKAKREKRERQEADERRIIALTEAIEAEAAARESRAKQSTTAADLNPEVKGVTYHNPYPVRKVNTSTLESPRPAPSLTVPKPYNFANIEKVVKDTTLDSSTDSSTGHLTGESGLTFPFTYTLKTGTMLKAKSLKELQAKILTATRSQETKQLTVAQKKRALRMKAVSDRITSASTHFSRSEENIATPLELNMKNKTFYNKGDEAMTRVKAAESRAAEEADELMTGLSDAVGDFAESAARHWTASSQSTLAMMTSRSEGIAETSTAVDSYSNKMFKDDALVSGNSDDIKEAASTTPGFLSTYAASLAADFSEPETQKKFKKDKKKERKAAAAAASITAATTSTVVEELTETLNKIDLAASVSSKSKEQQDNEDKQLLEKQLQAQGVTVDEKMKKVIASLSEP